MTQTTSPAKSEFIALLSTGGAETVPMTKGQSLAALPLRILTCYGARVALQRCPILRAGSGTLSRLQSWRSEYCISKEQILRELIP
jgi:hypothetical protein